MATVHLICGGTGAGKTTYAAALAQRLRAVRFSTDEWMAGLFMADRPEPLTFGWAVERTARCERQMWSVADQLLARGVDVVFDVGLSRREHRDRFRQRAREVGAEPKLHYLDVDTDTRRSRVRERNTSRPATFSFEVTDAMFDWMERWFEAPTDDELYEAMIVCG
ncbi:MAG TPA: ATP-binding protein [Polyangiaceae bacterium]|nr:ATP-binding protein [Polyangiaceae bacterium]